MKTISLLASIESLSPSLSPVLLLFLLHLLTIVRKQSVFGKKKLSILDSIIIYRHLCASFPKMKYALVLTSTLVLGVSATPKPAITAAPRAPVIKARDLPASSGSSALKDVYTVAAGKSFDGGMVMYDRGVDCTGQAEGGDSDAVFQIEEGGSLSNVIIGPNQIEGVHCQGACTLNNVWWSAVCEDAFTVKNQDAGDTTYITGGGAYGAEDKVIQHNGGGTISISGFTVDDFGKLYRSCGNCDDMYERHVILDSITASDGSALVGKKLFFSSPSLPPDFSRRPAPRILGWTSLGGLG